MQLGDLIFQNKKFSIHSQLVFLSINVHFEDEEFDYNFALNTTVDYYLFHIVRKELKSQHLDSLNARQQAEFKFHSGKSQKKNNFQDGRFKTEF